MSPTPKSASFSCNSFSFIGSAVSVFIDPEVSVLIGPEQVAPGQDFNGTDHYQIFELD